MANYVQALSSTSHQQESIEVGAAQLLTHSLVCART